MTKCYYSNSCRNQTQISIYLMSNRKQRTIGTNSIRSYRGSQDVYNLNNLTHSRSFFLMNQYISSPINKAQTTYNLKSQKNKYSKFQNLKTQTSQLTERPKTGLMKKQSIRKRTDSTKGVVIASPQLKERKKSEKKQSKGMFEPKYMTNPQKSYGYMPARSFEMKKRPQLPKVLQKIKIMLQLIKTKAQSVQVLASMTIDQLKQHIYDTISKQLFPQQFSLYHEGIKLEPNLVISSVQGMGLWFKQQLNPIHNLTLSSQGVLQQFNAIYNIDNFINLYNPSRTKFRNYIHEQLIEGSTTFKQSAVIKGKITCIIWKLQDIRLIGGYTATQIQNIKEHININKNRKITIRLMDNKEFIYQIESNTTVLQIKKYIQKQKKYPELLLQQTKLTYEDTWLKNNTNIQSVLRKHFSSERVILVQQLAEIREIQSQEVDPNKLDPISEQPGVFKMQCAHYLGSSVHDYVRYEFVKGEIDVKCPISVSKDTLCNKIWKEQTWRLVGRFTKTEMQEFSQLKSINWIKKHSKLCPHCSSSVFFPNLNSKRVSHCNKPDFCFDCLQPWKSKTTVCCSVQCQSERSILASCQFTRQFQLKEQGKKDFTIFMTPTHRACPRCHQVIQNYVGCKHSTCPCGEKFCFVCLKSRAPNVWPWPCGSYDSYCGKVAPRQKL